MPQSIGAASAPKVHTLFHLFSQMGSFAMKLHILEIDLSQFLSKTISK